MAQHRKYFGMTGSQIGILAGMAFLVFCLIGIMVYLIFGDGLPFGNSSQQIPTPRATATLVVFPTATPTALPTPIPYEQLIPVGWVQHKTSLIEIWLPSDYKVTKEKLFIEDPSNPAVREIQFATSTSQLYREAAGIFYEPLTANSLDEFLDNDLPKLPPEVRLTERRNELVNSTPVVRVLLEQKIENIDVNVLVYVFLDGGTVWYVEYAAQINEFYELLDIFERSVRTFRFVK